MAGYTHICLYSTFHTKHRQRAATISTPCDCAAEANAFVQLFYKGAGPSEGFHGPRRNVGHRPHGCLASYWCVRRALVVGSPCSADAGVVTSHFRRRRPSGGWHCQLAIGFKHLLANAIRTSGHTKSATSPSRFKRAEWGCSHDRGGGLDTRRRTCLHDWPSSGRFARGYTGSPNNLQRRPA